MLNFEKRVNWLKVENISSERLRLKDERNWSGISRSFVSEFYEK